MGKTFQHHGRVIGFLSVFSANFVLFLILIVYMALGNRIQDLRKQKGLTQADLAELVKVSLTQMQRYEAKGVQPPANVLLSIANVLDTSVDFLMSGDKNQRVKQALKDAELINQFKAVEQMSDKDKGVIKALIDAFITKKQLQKMVG